MTDPAIEAAQRAWAQVTTYASFGRSAWFTNDQQIAAAREALKPIREWSDKHRGECSWIDELLDDLAPLIYTTEELE